MIIPEALLHRRITTPERNLLVALLHRALLDYFGSRRSDKDDARDWLFEESDERDAFSFSWVCSHLDLDRKEILTRIKSTEVSERSLEMWGMRRTA